MRAVNILTFTLVFLSFAILIRAGHVVVPLGLLELISIPVYFTADGIVDDESVLFIFLAFVGHILLVLALFSKRRLKKIIFILAGEIFMLLAIIFFTKDFQTNEGAKFMSGWSIPAIINMIVLSFYLFFNRKRINFLNRKIVREK